MQPVSVAAVQMVSGMSVDDNLTSMRRLVSQAAQGGAKLVVLPEYFCLMGQDPRDKVRVAEAAWEVGGSGAAWSADKTPIQLALAQTARQQSAAQPRKQP